MFASRKTFLRLITSSYFPIARCSTINTSENVLHFKPKFTDEEQKKILNVVNQENVEQLAKFDVTRGRIRNLEIWRMKNGPFQSLSDILEVEGLGEKVLERLCKSIILNKTTENTVKTNSKNSNRKQLVTPVLDKDIIARLHTVVGIHSCSTGISWAKIDKQNNEVHDWQYQDFSFLPKKLLPNETYNLAKQIVQQLPDADIYVMEASPTISPQSPLAAKAMPTYNQQLELTSMLMALINSSSNHGYNNIIENSTQQQYLLDNDGLQHILGNNGRQQHVIENNGSRNLLENKLDSYMGSNKVYYLRAYLSARLFKTLVGNERVSSGAIITKFINGEGEFPCTAIVAREKLKSNFLEKSSVHKDLLGQALMLTVSFMDLCVNFNTVSLKALNRGRRSNN